jgi:hypothetical protein
LDQDQPLGAQLADGGEDVAADSGEDAAADGGDEAADCNGEDAEFADDR